MVTLTDIQNARKNIANVVRETPILASMTLSSISRNDVFLKSEHLQKTGSFKIRGATNKVKDVVEKGEKNVVAASSGNHGQAVASTAHKLGIRATIVVPEDATACKVDAIHGYQANVIYCGTTSTERLQRAEELSCNEDTVIIPPYDEPLILAGQGTIGLELLDQVENTDLVYVSIGGGGLISGIATAIKETNPSIKIIGVEPETAKDTFLSIKKGEIVSINKSKTIADGLRTSQPGSLTFPIMQKYLDDVVLVTEDEIKEVFSILLQRTKQLVEPSGAVSVAAAISNKANTHGKRVVAVASGGNIDLTRINSLL
jgi:threonine dehydratase